MLLILILNVYGQCNVKTSTKIPKAVNIKSAFAFLYMFLKRLNIN